MSKRVLPACAGVILDFGVIPDALASFTRMRGGDPNVIFLRFYLSMFYPHARG